MLGRVLETLIPVRRDERRLTLALFFHSLCAVGAFTTGRTVRDALFLAHADRASLPWMYVASAVAVAFTGLLYGRFAARVRRDQMAVLAAALFGSLFVGLWIVERSQEPWVYTAIYIYVEVMGALALVQFWTLANDLFNAREARRLYGFIGAGGTFANIFIGLLQARVAAAFGTQALLLLCAGLLGGTAIIAAVGGRVGRQRLFARAATGRGSATRTGGAARVLSDRHLRAVALLSAVTFFTTTLVDFQFKVVAAERLAPESLAVFFGYISSAVGVLALGLQLFGTSRTLNRVGVIGALMVLPATLALGNASLLIFPALWAATLTKGADSLFRYSINDSTTQILYLPVPAQARAAAKAFIDGVVKPGAIGLGGLLLVAYRMVGDSNPYRLAWLSLALSLVWAAVVLGLRSKYLRSLQENLKQRRLDLDTARHRVADASTNEVLERALSSSDHREVLNALQLLPHLENLKLDHKVEALLTHELPEVRVRVLEYYAHRKTMRFANSVFLRFEDRDPAVRAAAIDAFCAIGKDKAVRSVRSHLSDPDPRIRSAAVTGMIRFGGLDGVLMAAEALKQLISHEDPVMRQYAARVLGAIGVKNFYQPVLQLMNDRDLRVRREAITAAGLVRSQEFVIPLIYRTAGRDTTREAIEALTAHGETIIPTLAKVLGNPLEDPNIRLGIARVLGRLATPEAVVVIAAHLDERDEELRERLYRALARAVKGRRLLLQDLAPVRRALARELERAYRALHHAEALGLGSGPSSETRRHGEEGARALLAAALAEKVAQVEERAFLLLAVLYPDADMEQIHAGIRDAAGADAARRRGNAVELLDNLLDRPLKRRFLPLLEDQPRAERLRSVAEDYPPPGNSPFQALMDLCKDEASWVRACAVWCLGEVRGSDQPRGEEVLASAATDHSPIVREIALVTLERSAPNRALLLAEARLRDEAPTVRRQATLIASRSASSDSASRTAP